MDQVPADVTAESAGNESPAKRFVGYVIERIAKDNGFAARLKRADNPATEYQSWEIPAGFGIDTEKSGNACRTASLAPRWQRRNRPAMAQSLWGPPLPVVIPKAISLNRRKLACDGCWPVLRPRRSVPYFAPVVGINGQPQCDAGFRRATQRTAVVLRQQSRTDPRPLGAGILSSCR